MPKEIKGNPRRKPPVPAEHSDIEEWLGGLMPNLRPIAGSLDASIRDVISDLDYAVKFNRAFYGLPELGWVIEIAPYFLSMNVLFLGGADFDSPPPLGTVGRTRYIKVRTLDEAMVPELQVWFGQAGRTPGWK